MYKYTARLTAYWAGTGNTEGGRQYEKVPDNRAPTRRYARHYERLAAAICAAPNDRYARLFRGTARTGELDQGSWRSAGGGIQHR
jgi:hypothetical protein